jgi:hypothetical protein
VVLFKFFTDERNLIEFLCYEWDEPLYCWLNYFIHTPCVDPLQSYYFLIGDC